MLPDVVTTGLRTHGTSTRVKGNLSLGSPMAADENREMNNGTQITVFTHGADGTFHETNELMDAVFMISTTLGNDDV